MKRSRIRPVSQDRLDRAEERRQLIDRIYRAQGYRCALWWHPTACGGPMDGHEVVRASCHREGRWDEQIVIAICRTHHNLDTHMLEAERLGIRVRCPQWELVGYTAVEEQRARRAQWARQLEPPPDPSWWPEPCGDPVDSLGTGGG